MEFTGVYKETDPGKLTLNRSPRARALTFTFQSLIIWHAARNRPKAQGMF